MTHRHARTAAALATALLVAGFAPSAVASTSTSRDADAGLAADARGGEQWHLTAALGRGPRKLKFFTCSTGTAPGDILFHYKAATRKSSDNRYPRYEYDIVDGGSTGSAEDALFPGGLVYSSVDGPWTVNAQVHLKLRNLGKTKTKDFTIGQVLAC